MAKGCGSRWMIPPLGKRASPQASPPRGVLMGGRGIRLWAELLESARETRARALRYVERARGSVSWLHYRVDAVHAARSRAELECDAFPCLPSVSVRNRRAKAKATNPGRGLSLVYGVFTTQSLRRVMLLRHMACVGSHTGSLELEDFCCVFLTVGLRRVLLFRAACASTPVRRWQT